MPCSARPAARNWEQQSTAGQRADLGNEAVPAGLRPKILGRPAALQHPLPSPPSLAPLTSSKAALGWSVPLGDSPGMTLTPLWQRMTSDDNGDLGAGSRAESWPSSQNTLTGFKGVKLFKGKKQTNKKTPSNQTRASLQLEDPFQESDYKLPLGWKQRSFRCLPPLHFLLPSPCNKGDQQSTQRALSLTLWKTRKRLFHLLFMPPDLLLSSDPHWLPEFFFSHHFYAAHLPLLLNPPPQHMVLRVSEGQSPSLPLVPLPQPRGTAASLTPRPQTACAGSPQL